MNTVHITGSFGCILVLDTIIKCLESIYLLSMTRNMKKLKQIFFHVNHFASIKFLQFF